MLVLVDEIASTVAELLVVRHVAMILEIVVSKLVRDQITQASELAVHAARIEQASRQEGQACLSVDAARQAGATILFTLLSGGVHKSLIRAV